MTIQEHVLGIIGTGALARYCVAGLRNASDDRTILLSPRNAQVAAELAAHHGCQVMVGNQLVVDGADLVLFATRPADAGSALKALRFRSGQTLVSVVAGIPLAELNALAKPARVVRSMPLCCAEVNAGAIPLWPDDPEVRALLSTLGEVLAMPDEAAFELAFVASCANGWFHRLYAELEDWLVEAGFEPAQARTLALQAAHGASSLDLAHPDVGPGERASRIATPDTYTRLGLDALDQAGVFSALRASFDLIRRQIKDQT
mgnify:CR=1 FL=1